MNKTFIIAELSANHGQNIDIGLKTIEAMAEVGADAVKVQTYTPDTITIDCDNEYFQVKGTELWDGQTLYELYQKAYTPWEWHKPFKEKAEECGLVFFSSPFDFSSVDFLEELEVPIFKIASAELIDLPLIEYVASKGKPIIMSTGIANEKDIHEAIKVCHKVDNHDIVLLKCTSSYPASIEDANLKTIPDMKERFGVKVGLSDHTRGIEVALASVALGAEVVEKHFILDKDIASPDAAFSMEPDEFKVMVDGIRKVEKAIGQVSYQLRERGYERSLFTIKNIKKGEKLTKENIRSIRPGYGLHPKYFKKIVGEKITENISKGTPLSWDIIK